MKKLKKYWFVQVFVLLSVATGTAQNAKVLQNPFTLENQGIPYRIPICGVGLPTKAPLTTIQNTIREVMAQSGINLQEGYTWQGKSGAVTLDGYDTLRRMGFVITHYSRESGGVCQNPWIDKYTFSLRQSTQKSLESDYETDLYFRRLNGIEQLYMFHGNIDTAVWGPQFRALEQRIIRRQQVDFMMHNKFRIAYYFLCGDSKITPVTRSAAQSILHETDPVRFEKKLDHLGQLIDSNLVFTATSPIVIPLADSLNTRASRWMKADFFPEKSKRLADLRLLGKVVNNIYWYKDTTLKGMLDAYFTLPETSKEAQKLLKKIRFTYSGFIVTLSEMQEINQLSQKGQSFILVIPYQSPACNLSWHSKLQERYEQSPESTKKWSDLSEKEKDDIQINDYRSRLSYRVEQYLQWAAAQKATNPLQRK